MKLQALWNRRLPQRGRVKKSEMSLCRLVWRWIYSVYGRKTLDDVVQTQFGWATKSEQPPRNRDLLWVSGNGHIYVYDGEDNGWVRINPPIEYPTKDINHG